jgi:hypothetical protein
MGKIKEDFLSVRSFITIGAFFLAYIMMSNQQMIPDLLRSIIDLLLGFWFGSKMTKPTEGETK